ncbi:dihydrodipicolinate synthase family protein [Jiangella asiatica]|uniref:Dihydrodipicolinate synthase family protein n=1 Tax=Jiangella asiatica TaxID=2530372 RepID=A0A4R5DE92_9ACTN|nr:dihydrodipicolinate synthase family protein [Jiangella asiatica]TDE10171.1 dihydrodipicolinate synthase family protein [Jiangella asiatica]
MNAAEPAGLYPATVTPFASSMKIDFPALEAHLSATAAAPGIRGLVVNGHLGEILALDAKERVDIVSVAKSTCTNGQVVYAGIVGYRAEDLVEQGLRAKVAGADGLLVLPPIDVRPYRRLAANPDSVLHFFAELDKRVGLPMVVHQYPDFTGAAYPLAVLSRLAELEHVVAVKAASVDISTYTELWDTLSEKTRVLVATDAPGLLGMLLHGSHGALIGIAAIEPALWAEFLRLVDESPLEHARDLFVRSCLPLMDAVFENQVPRGMESEASATKEALVQLGQIPSSRVRLPSVEVSEQRKLAIRDALVRAGLMQGDGVGTASA